MGIRWCCGGKGKRNLNKFIGGLCINCWSGLGASNGGGARCKLGDWIAAFDPLFIWVARISDGKLVFMILSPQLEIPEFAFWFSLLPLVPAPVFIANLADTRRFLKLLWWSILRESSLDDGKTFINGCFFVQLSVLCVKLATLDVIFADDIDDDDGGKCDGCKLFITLSSATLHEEGEGRFWWCSRCSCSGVVDRVRQFFNHNSGVIKCSTIK